MLTSLAGVRENITTAVNAAATDSAKGLYRAVVVDIDGNAYNIPATGSYNLLKNADTAFPADPIAHGYIFNTHNTHNIDTLVLDWEEAREINDDALQAAEAEELAQAAADFDARHSYGRHARRIAEMEADYEGWVDAHTYRATLLTA